MKSVGEVMALGRDFGSALLKAMRSLEQSGAEFDFTERVDLSDPAVREDVRARLAHPTADRIHTVRLALASGMSVEDVFDASWIDPWYLDQILQLQEVADAVADADDLSRDLLALAKETGLSDRQIAQLRGMINERTLQPSITVEDHR